MSLISRERGCKIYVQGTCHICVHVLDVCPLSLRPRYDWLTLAIDLTKHLHLLLSIGQPRVTPLRSINLSAV